MTSCESKKAHGAAVQFAFAWEQTIKGLGFEHLSDLKTIEKVTRDFEQTRSVITAEGSENMQREARQLDALVLYLAQTLDENIQANLSRPDAGPDAKPIPVNFSNSGYNALLGLNPQDGDDNPEKALAGLHQAIVRFAEATGAGNEFAEAKRVRDASSSDNKRRRPQLGWAQVREAKVRLGFERKAALIRERETIAAEVLKSKGPAGFEGAKWLMSREEVKNVRPTVEQQANGNLIETMDWLGRPAGITYSFDTGFLVTVIVTFRGKANAGDFGKTQDFLKTDYEKISAPVKGREFLLSSRFKAGRFSVEHLLWPSNIEQVLFSRDNDPL